MKTRWKLLGLLAIGLIFFTMGLISFLHEDELQWPPLETNWPGHKLCVIIPYRDRRVELEEMAPRLTVFLRQAGILFDILVMSQVDSLRFNRASLVNVGWLEGDRRLCDYMVMHDVDLVPLNPQIDYSYPGVGIVRHISSPQYHPKYNYTKFIGGILMLTMADFQRLDGMSNKYWGWGMEDDEFYLRIRDANLRLTRVENLTTDSTNTFDHIHDARQRPRDYAVVTDNQRAMKRKRDRVSGLHDVRYNIKGRDTERLRDDTTLHWVYVQLECDRTWTPYCELPSTSTVTAV